MPSRLSLRYAPILPTVKTGAGISLAKNPHLQVHEAGGKILSFLSFAGGLPGTLCSLSSCHDMKHYLVLIC